MSFGENDSVLKSIPPDRTAGSPIDDMRASTHADLQVGGLGGGQVVGVDEHGVGDAAGGGEGAGVAGQRVGGDEPAGAGLERAVAVGFADGDLVPDVQDVGGDVERADRVAAQPVTGRCRR